MKYFVALVALLLAGCVNHNEEPAKCDNLVITDKLIRIPIGEEVYPQTIAVQLFESKDSVRYICYLNQEKNEIYFF